MAKGKVKWFNPTKGYGFIECKEVGSDIFVHISAVQAAGLKDLQEDQVIEFDVVENQGKKSAENIKA